MSQKIKTVTLSYPWPDRDSNRVDLYRVETLTDSTDFIPHQFLKKSEVDSLCMSRDWKVTIKPNASLS